MLRVMDTVNAVSDSLMASKCENRPETLCRCGTWNMEQINICRVHALHAPFAWAACALTRSGGTPTLQAESASIFLEKLGKGKSPEFSRTIEG